MSVGRGVEIIKIGMPSDMIKGRRYAKARSLALLEVGIIWFKEMLPDHFEDGADSRYGYQKRKAKYLKSKMYRAKRSGKYSNKPLTLTGLTKNMSTRTAKINATGNQVTIRYKVPAYVSVVGKSNFVSKEMKILTNPQRKQLARAYVTKFNEAANSLSTKSRTRI